MDTVFTHGYNKIAEISGFKLNINDNSRWVCCLFKDSIGVKGEQVTIIDNYCEPYIMTIDKDNMLSINKGSIDPFNKTISLTPERHFLHQLPDIAIDVLQSCSHPVGLEVLSRIAKVVHKKIGNSRSLISGSNI